MMSADEITAATDTTDPVDRRSALLEQWRGDVGLGRTTLGFDEWVAALDASLVRRPAMTVAALIDRLSEYPLDTRVLVDAEMPGLFEIAAFVGPIDSVAFVLPTIMCGAHFDCRTV
jgi:hypothetical protein